MKNLKSHLKFLPLLLAVVLVIALFLIFRPDPIRAAAGNWTKSGNTEIYWVETADSQISNGDLKDQIQLFAKELKEKVGYDLPISYGKLENAGANDIVLNLNRSNGVAVQGYSIAASTTNVVISASDADGLFYGCRNLIKQLMLSGYVASKNEAPDVLERGLSLDNGRKYFSADWIKELIRELSWSDMNCLTLHFSEEMGVGIESKLYPWLNGRDGRLSTQGVVATDNRQLTQAEVVDIIKYAKLYHVDVIPSLDTPGHMNYIVMKFNEQCATKDYSFTFDGTTYTAKAGSEIGNYLHVGTQTAIVQGSDASGTNNFAKAHSRGIDISNEVAVAFTKSLVKEYATLFYNAGCTKIDIGGDELLGWGGAITSGSKWKQLEHWQAYARTRTGNNNAVAYDAFLLYMNDMNDFVRDIGYTSVRMWNDDVLRTDTGWTGVVQLSTEVEIWYWYTSQAVTNYINKGYKLYNILGDYNYFAMKSSHALYDENAYPQNIYEKWNPYLFSDTYTTSSYKLANGHASVLGSALGVWCDRPDAYTEAETMDELVPMIQAHGAKAWDCTANSTATWSVFTSRWNTLGAAPAGTSADTEVYEVPDRTALQTLLAEAATMDLTYRTQATADAYQAAVAAGRTVMDTLKPTQAQVDAAAQAIRDAKAALAYPNPAPLQALVDEYAGMDGSQYKPETFVAYTKAIEKAQTFLQQAPGTYTEVQLNQMIATTAQAKNELRDINEVTGAECFISGDFKASTVYVGKVATINMSVVKGTQIKAFAVYNDLGTSTEIIKQTSSTYKTDRDNYSLQFNATGDLVGERTYYVYAIYEDGAVSGDFLELNVTVKN
jgi:hypothetical protein